WFETHGGLTRANGQRFRDMILSRGHSQDSGVMFRAFTGHDPQVAPMLEARGLVAESGGAKAKVKPAKKAVRKRQT
ncbi:M3 family metallopeptidase, partial [Streptomyces turgidiscabies]|uniref:M3 family metallopeptidase n=1 Tax=Streptomyces turgidiscabies TaxID=85558 RepID=UPI0038F81B5C